MRPRGEIRQALHQAAHELAQAQGGATWRTLAERACVGYAAARRTVRNMAQAGHLQPVGEERAPHSRRPMVRYAPAATPGQQATRSTTTAGAALAQAWR